MVKPGDKRLVKQVADACRNCGGTGRVRGGYSYCDIPPVTCSECHGAETIWRTTDRVARP